MNEFETRINALRLQHKAERMQIQQDCDRLFTTLNADIAAAESAEARRAIRAEKRRIWLDTRRSLRWEMRCYRQQLDWLNALYQAHLEANPSRRQARRALEILYRYAQDPANEGTLSLAFGDNLRGEVHFSDKNV